MESATLNPQAPAAASTRPAAVEQRTLSPIKWWAGIGVAFVLLIVYVYAAWFISGDATATPSGPDEAPTFMKVTAIVFQILSPLIALTLVYLLVIRPWRREGKVPFDGLFILALGSMWWQDPIVNYTQVWASYNTELVNLGSWSAQIPFWSSPNGEKFAEPLFFTGWGYMYALFFGAVAANWVMRKAQEKRPGISKASLIGIAFLFIATFDLIMEASFMRFGLYTYGGSIPEWTLFHGHYYQFPIYEALLWGGVWTLWASVRFFRNDKGESIVERGVEKLNFGEKRKTLVRLLALVGVMNALCLFVFNIPFQLFSAKSGPWVEDSTSRSYMMDRLCGPQTEYACPGPDIPIVKRDSARIDTDGKLILPAENRFAGE